MAAACVAPAVTPLATFETDCAAVPTAEEIEDVAKTATRTVASAQARKPWAVSRKKTSSVCSLTHLVRSRLHNDKPHGGQQGEGGRRGIGEALWKRMDAYLRQDNIRVHFQKAVDGLRGRHAAIKALTRPVIWGDWLSLRGTMPLSPRAALRQPTWGIFNRHFWGVFIRR